MSKTTIAFAVIYFFISAQQSKAQYVSLDIKNGKVSEVMKAITNQNYIPVIIKEDALRDAKPVTIQGNHIPINQVIQICNKDQYFIATFKDGAINISPRYVTIKVKILNDQNEPVNDVLVNVEGSNISRISDQHGCFSIPDIYANAKLSLSSINIENISIDLAGNTNFTIRVKHKVTEFNEVNVFVNLGYMSPYKRMGTASINYVPKSLFEQRASTSPLDALQGRVGGLLPISNPTSGVYQAQEVTIGARSTLYNSPDPLIVLDNFPYLGKISDINPDEIESISILRDAAASSIWGARAGNGVIVITTRQAKLSQKFNISFNTWAAMWLRPDLFYDKRMASSDYIDVQKKLYAGNFYLPLIYNNTHPALSPVAEILWQNHNHQLSDQVRDSIINSWYGHDNRYDQQNSFYRNSSMSHNYLQMYGGNGQLGFSASAGYDFSSPEIRGSSKNKWTVDIKNLYRIMKNLELQVGIIYAGSKERNTEIPLQGPTYLPLTDKNGNDIPYDYERRTYYIDTVTRTYNNLAGWHYYPKQEFDLRNQMTVLKNLIINMGLHYHFFKDFTAQTSYQYQSLSKEIDDIKDKKSYYVRNLVNTFSQLVNGDISRVIPLSDIRDVTENKYGAHNIRAMLTYAKPIGYMDSLLIMSGFDGIITNNTLSNERTYGYNANTAGTQNDLNYRIRYPKFYDTSLTALIPYPDPGFRKSTGYVSYYINGNYILKSRYYFSTSARLDKSSLYGDSTNGKSLPLFSAGFAWDMHAEKFYNIGWLPLLKIRMTLGITGNNPTDVSPYTTIRYNGVNYNGDQLAYVNNPPLPSLRWEQVTNSDMGINFRLKDYLLEGSIDWYHKLATHLTSNHEIDPTTGSRFAVGNVGSIVSNEIDLALNSKITSRKFSWYGHLVFTYMNEKVKTAPDSLQPAWYYSDPTYFTVVPGRAPYSVYSFKYLGPDPITGDPVGSFGNEKSKKYTDILTKQGYAELVYHGRGTPPIFGGLTNEFVYDQFTLSFTLLYKFNYYFHRKSINYYDLYYGNDFGTPEYKNRWQNPGDELKTKVPSAPTDYLNLDRNRDLLYNLSEVNVERGDHIRLQNILASYSLKEKLLKKLCLKSAVAYININNVGIIWKANHQGIDPDQITGIPTQKMFAIGFKVGLE